MEENTVLTKLSTEVYTFICNSVLDYMNGFSSSDEHIQQNYDLKKEHTHRVIGYTEVLSRSLELEEEQVLCAELTALLHDIGRFEQFKQYQTFNDYVSVDHAELGAQIIREKKWLDQLQEEYRNIIIETVSLHNKIEIPKNTDDEIALIAQIIRDADKLDILDLAVKEYTKPRKTINPAFTLELQDSILISKAIAKCITAEKLPNRKDMKTTTDFKLVQMAFVYDLNFKESFSIVNKKGLLKKLFDVMPKSDQVFELYRKTKIYVENHLI